MSKFFKTLAALVLILACLGFYGMHVLEDQMVQHLPPLLKKVRSVQTGPVRKGNCRFSACVVIPDVVVKGRTKTPIALGNITLSVPPLYPIRIGIKNESSPISMNATIGQNKWDIQNISGTIQNMTFQLTGKINIPRETGELNLKTTGLKTFLQQNMDIPPALAWFFSDSDSTLSFIPKNGYLTFQGFPLLPLSLSR